MAIEYSFLLNGEALYATLGATTVDKLEEALDESVLHIPITVRDYEYKMYGLLEITANDTVNDPLNFTYLIMSDDVNVVSKDGFYSHDLKAIEYTNKLDKFLVNSATFTKPFIQKRRAPFVYEGQEQTDLGFILAIMPEGIEIYSHYFTNETITIPQVGGAYLLSSGNSQYDVYIKSDATGNTTAQNLTDGDATFEFTETGVIEIEVGVINGSSVEVPVFTFTSNVVDEVRYTLYDMVDTIRAISPIESRYYHEGSRLFNLDSELVDLFKSIEMPQMFFQQMTTRQILNTIFKYINAISRLHYVDGENDELTVDYFNKIGGSFTQQDILDFKTSQNVSGYATKAISWLQNSLQSNFRDNPSVNSPATNRYKTVRARNVQLLPENFEIQLEKPIYELSKVEVVIPRVAITTDTGVSSTSIDDYTIDITHRFLEKRFWDLKSYTVDFPNAQIIDAFDENIGLRENRVGNLFWDRNSNKINMSTAVGEYYLETLLINVLQEAVNEQITLTPAYMEVGGDVVFALQIPTNVEDGGTNTLFRNVKFNFEYITLENTTLQVQRENVSSINYESEIKINQNAKVTDFGRSSRDAYGKLQRSGTPNLTFTKVYTDLDPTKILSVGMIDENGYIITQRALSFYNEHIEAIYEATLNHNRLNEFNGINQEYRVFENPRFENIYERRDFYTDYVMIDKPTTLLKYRLDNPPTYLQDDIFELMFKRLYDYDTDLDKITYTMVRTDGFLEYYPDDGDYYAIMTPTVSYGGKGGLLFTFGFKDNILAGNSIKKDGGTKFYNEPIRYTNEFGFFDEIWFAMGNSYVATDTFTDIAETSEDYFNEEHKYPLVKHSDTELNQTFLIKSGDLTQDAFSYNPIISYKDASSNYFVNYQISILPLDFNEYILGQMFYTDNRLVRNPYIENGENLDSKMYLYRYSTQTNYGVFDDLKVKSGYLTPVELTTSNMSYSSGVWTFSGTAEVVSGTHTGWAIGDEDENLYMACNYDYNGFSIVARHYRLNMLNIGNKTKVGQNDVLVELSLTYQADLIQSTSTNMNLDANISISIDTVEGQDEYEETILTVVLSGVLEQGTSTSMSLEASIITSIDVTEGQDEYEETILNLVYEADLIQSSSTNMSLDGSLQVNVDVTEGQDEYEETIVTLILSSDLVQSANNMVLSGDIELSVNEDDIAKIYAWSSTSKTTTTVEQDCLNADDLTNVKSYQSTSCSFVAGSFYFSSVYIPTVIPSCSDGATYTVCTWQPEYGQYTCVDRTGVETTTTRYLECKLVDL